MPRLAARQPVMNALLHREAQGITFSLFEPYVRDLKGAVRIGANIRQQISKGFTLGYLDELDGDIATGFPILSHFDELSRNFPEHDFARGSTPSGPAWVRRPHTSDPRRGDAMVTHGIREALVTAGNFPQLLTAEQVSTLLGVSAATLNRWAALRETTGEQIGPPCYTLSERVRRWDCAEVRSWLKQVRR